MNNNELETAYNERFLVQEEYLGTNKVINNITPLVSITVATYQHVGYIAECLESLLTQQTSFPYEIIVGDDGSTDGTTEVCKMYANKHPNKIRLFIRDRNLSQFINSEGANIRFNGLWNRMSARGKYIAWCDGDDYWIDPFKLQKQVDFLENHSEYAMVYTSSEVYDQYKNKIEDYLLGSKFKDFNDLLTMNRIPTLTTCIRKNVIMEYVHDIKPEQQNWLMGDYPMWLWIAYYHKIKFFPEATTMYRMLSESASHSRNLEKQEKFDNSIIDITTFYIKKFSILPAKEYLVSINSLYFHYYDIYLHKGCYKKAKHYAKLVDYCHTTDRIRKKIRLFHLRFIKYKIRNLFYTKIRT